MKDWKGFGVRRATGARDQTVPFVAVEKISMTLSERGVGELRTVVLREERARLGAPRRVCLEIVPSLGGWYVNLGL